ncbi:LysR family transcriptional regulator [Halocynthiibacter namhaensis]|uniref:LysR family transcriptional regulator n=1 Tax=Halocynthiibacter namhaensis TaxID=1290553 RepID=UPI00057984BE|nr:LysR family transcriptional regulator [Halocynthiibacter namhaensis]
MGHSRIPSLNWLRVFEAAAREESFARAAEKLNLSAPAVSQQVRALEDHLGRQLFVRGPQKVQLTPAGAAFLPVVQQALASVETTAAALFGGQDQKSITLQAVSLLAMSWLPSRLAAFEEANPGMRVNLITGETLSDFRTILPGREPDLQIAFGSVTDFADTAEPFLRETLRVVARPEMVAGVQSAQDLTSHGLYEVAAHRSGWHQVLATQPDVDMRDMDLRMVDSTPLAFSFAGQGLGFALARAPASDDLVQALGLKACPLFPPVPGVQRYFFLTPGGRALSRGAQKLKYWLKSEGDHTR